MRGRMYTLFSGTWPKLLAVAAGLIEHALLLRNIQRIGIGVSAEAQQIFDAMART